MFIHQQPAVDGIFEADFLAVLHIAHGQHEGHHLAGVVPADDVVGSDVRTLVRCTSVCRWPRHQYQTPDRTP